MSALAKVQRFGELPIAHATVACVKHSLADTLLCS
jgi:hypothetical protein